MVDTVVNDDDADVSVPLSSDFESRPWEFSVSRDTRNIVFPTTHCGLLSTYETGTPVGLFRVVVLVTN